MKWESEKYERTGGNVELYSLIFSISVVGGDRVKYVENLTTIPFPSVPQVHDIRPPVQVLTPVRVSGDTPGPF
jgi:hypothetical protein